MEVDHPVSIYIYIPHTAGHSYPSLIVKRILFFDKTDVRVYRKLFRTS